MNNSRNNRRQFSLATIFLVTTATGVSVGTWTWLSETVPGGLAAFVILCWVCGVALLVSTSSLRFDENPRHGVLQLVAGLGCGVILVGPLIAMIVWLVLNY